MAPLKTISVPRVELSAALFLSLAWCISRAQPSNSRISSVIAGRTLSLHSPGWVCHLRKPLSPIVFRLCTPFWSFLASCSDSHQSRGLCITWFRPWFFRDTYFIMIRSFMVLHYPLKSHALPSDIPLEQCPEPPVCIARYIKLESCVALLFVAKIATNYRLPVSFSKSTLTL